MRKHPPGELRELLLHQVEAVSELAIRERGRVPAHLIDDLTNLEQLVKLHESVIPPASGKRWILPVTLFTTLLMMSALLFVRLPTARVDLDIGASTVAFTLDDSQDLASNIQVSSISASGLHGIDISGFDRPDRPDSSNPGGADSIRLSLAGSKQGTITLDKIQLPAKTRVTLATLDGVNRFRVAWQLPANARPGALSLSALGDVELGLSASPPQVSHLGTPTAVELMPGSDVVLDLDLAGNSPLALEVQLPVSGLSFATVHESSGVEARAQLVSTIRTGAVFIQSLNGQKYDLRAGARLRFSDSQGEMQKALIGPHGISLQFEGDVRGMLAGSREFPTSLMPSLLDWLRARHGLSLLWGSTLYIVGMLTVVLRWFRVID